MGDKFEPRIQTNDFVSQDQAGNGSYANNDDTTQSLEYNLLSQCLKYRVDRQ